MLPVRSAALRMGLLVCVLLPLAACSNTPWAANLERSLAADSRLQTSPALTGASPAEPISSSQLPVGFPGEIPRYPGAEFVAARQPDPSQPTQTPTQTQWKTPDQPAQVRQFYQEKLQSDGWQIVSPGGDGADGAAPIAATRDSLRITVEIPPSASATEFSISYFLDENLVAQSSPDASPGASLPDSSEFIGPLPPSDWPSQKANPASPSTEPATSLAFTDLNQAPQELQQYVTDLAKLGALGLRVPGQTANSTASNQAFKPNQVITRREYARWLVSANNQIYANQPTRQIRLGIASDSAAFSDVPSSDPDFGAIQGLANAGLIASSLSGDGSMVSFRPNAPLTREDLILWKVPVDMRRSLPNANLEAIQQTWGFQDAAKINPKAQRAVIADHQNGDLANIRRAFGYTTLFQPQKPVTRAEAAAVLWYFGAQESGLSAKDALTSQPTKPTGG